MPFLEIDILIGCRIFSHREFMQDQSRYWSIYSEPSLDLIQTFNVISSVWSLFRRTSIVKLHFQPKESNNYIPIRGTESMSNMPLKWYSTIIWIYILLYKSQSEHIIFCLHQCMPNWNQDDYLCSLFTHNNPLFQHHHTHRCFKLEKAETLHPISITKHKSSVNTMILSIFKSTSQATNEIISKDFQNLQGNEKWHS